MQFMKRMSLFGLPRKKNSYNLSHNNYGGAELFRSTIRARVFFKLSLFFFQKIDR